LPRLSFPRTRRGSALDSSCVGTGQASAFDTHDDRGHQQLERFATEKLALALARVQEAEQVTSSKKVRRLLDRARKPLGGILRHRPGQTSGACLEMLTAHIAGISRRNR